MSEHEKVLESIAAENICIQTLLKTMLCGARAVHQDPYSAIPCHYNSLGNSKSVSWETGVILKNFVEWKRPRQIVELGTFRGYSTAWLILGTLLNGFGRVDTYDVVEEGHFGSMWYDFYELPKTMFRFHRVDYGIKNFEMPDEIDFVFHDSSHELEDTMAEMAILLPRIPAAGMILFDDMCYPDYWQMQGYLYSLFAKMPNWKFTVMPIGTGLGIAERMR